MENEVHEMIVQVMEWGRSGNMEKFLESHSGDYTRFSDLPPFTLQHHDLALRLKGSLFSELIDMEYSIKDLAIRIYSGVAVATYILEYSGVAVSGYTFEGRKIQKTARCTTVLRRESGRWVIVHEHLSDLPQR